jgi:hypothetical protein
MNELKYFFLKTKLENQDKKLGVYPFFDLIKNQMGWKEYMEIQDEFSKNSMLEGGEYELLTELGKNRLLDFEKKIVESKKKLENNKKLIDVEIKLAESNLEANNLNKSIAKKNEKNEKFNKWTTIANIIVGLVNVGLLVWQILKPA